MTAAPTGEVCLVTGASGFIGGHLVEALLAEGYRVRCLVRATSETALLRRLGAELVEGDVTSSESLTLAAGGCRYVVHAAAFVSDWGTVREIRRVNVAGTSKLLAAALGASVERFVHLSTTDVYGYPGGDAVGEEHPPGPFRNWYAQTKLEAEREVHRAAGRGAIEWVILRPATVYGPRSEEVVAEMAKAIRGGRMLLIDGGRPIAGLTYVTNVVDAALLALRHDAAPGQAFNVTDGLPVTWRQFADDLSAGLGCRRVRWSVPYGVASAIGVSLELGYRLLRATTRLRTRPLLSRQAAHVLGRPQTFSNQKARTVLGWEPRIDYGAGLEATLAWLLSAEGRPTRSPRAAAS
jgi:nucleoside-diphosphate-sugar epimerase